MPCFSLSFPLTIKAKLTISFKKNEPAFLVTYLGAQAVRLTGGQMQRVVRMLRKGGFGHVGRRQASGKTRHGVCGVCHFFQPMYSILCNPGLFTQSASAGDRKGNVTELTLGLGLPPQHKTLQLDHHRYINTQRAAVNSADVSICQLN